MMGCVAPGQDEPAGHTSQAYDAPEKEPVPAGHGEHAPDVDPEGEYVPFAQFDTGVAPTRHDDCNASGKEPVGHAVQVADPVVATEPAAHLTHVKLLVAATTLLAVPAGHSEHTDEPSDFPYVPTGHAVQLAALAPPMSALAYPRGQKLSQNVAPTADVHDPGGQRRHDVRPETGVYVPG